LIPIHFLSIKTSKNKEFDAKGAFLELLTGMERGHKEPSGSWSINAWGWC